MPSALLKKVRARGNLECSWQVILDNGRFSRSDVVRSEIARFAQDARRNLEQIYRKLLQGKFDFGRARGVAIPKSDGAIRPIVLASVEARLVQRAILNVLLDHPNLHQHFHNPHSFGGIRRREADDYTAVPAAIRAALGAIGNGARYGIAADISGFFTRVPKPHVISIIAREVDDPEFMELVGRGIHVELSNMAQLREHGAKFPIEEIGVAQGNSLSPLMGNILLSDFDHAMNQGDCTCIRYIDDFLILAPTRAAAEARLKLAKAKLGAFQMELSPTKTSAAFSVEEPFEFLGIQLANGFIRPSRDAQNRFFEKVQAATAAGKKALAGARQDTRFEKSASLIGTLKAIDGIVQGWGKHYFFCNDVSLLERSDDRISEIIGAYLGAYADARNRLGTSERRAILGVEQLAQMPRKPFTWPRKTAPHATAMSERSGPTVSAVTE